jgi:hypothetical protein
MAELDLSSLKDKFTSSNQMYADARDVQFDMFPLKRVLWWTILEPTLLVAYEEVLGGSQSFISL